MQVRVQKKGKSVWKSRYVGNVSVTQPRHQSWRLGNKRVYRASGEAQDLCCLYKGIRTPFLTHAFFFLYSSILSRSSSSAQAFAFSSHKGPPKMSGSGAGGKWMTSTVREKDIKKLRGAGIWPRESATVFRRRDKSSLLRNPMRWWYSFLILSAG